MRALMHAMPLDNRDPTCLLFKFAATDGSTGGAREHVQGGKVELLC
jgi:hypothetical protein